LLLGLVEFLANRFNFLIGIAVLEAERGRQPRVYESPPFPVAQLQPSRAFRNSWVAVCRRHVTLSASAPSEGTSQRAILSPRLLQHQGTRRGITDYDCGMPAVRGLASRPWPDQAPRLAGVQTTPLKRSMGAQLRPGSPLMIAITIDHPYRPIGIT
jgi:hypothetical protein